MSRRSPISAQRRGAALARPDIRRARERKGSLIQHFARIGRESLLLGVVRKAQIARVLAGELERGDAAPELRKLNTKLDSFCRFCRREPAFVREQLAVAKENAHVAGAT